MQNRKNNELYKRKEKVNIGEKTEVTHCRGGKKKSHIA